MKYRNITIIKHKTCSTWYCRPRDKYGNQVYISGRTQKDCLTKLKKFFNEEAHQNKTEVYTLFDWQKKWLETYKVNNVRLATLKGYNSMNKYLSTIMQKNIDKIQIIDILSVLNNIEHTRARQKVYEYLKDIFSRAFENQIIKNNIFVSIQKPKHEKLKEKRAFTSEEETSFVKACNEHIDGDYYLICLYQGLRAGECLAIKPNDIDLENKLLRIDESENQGNTLTKNKSSNRIMPIFDRTLPILEKYVNLPKDSRIFSKRYSNYEIQIKNITSKANVRNLTIHELRHTFITRCKELNIIEPVIQKWVGHTIGSKITATVYTHVNNEQIIKYIDIFNKKEEN